METSLEKNFHEENEEKPVLPCGSCDMKACSIITDENEKRKLGILQPCEKYRKFRKAIGEWWDKHPEELSKE